MGHTDRKHTKGKMKRTRKEGVVRHTATRGSSGKYRENSLEVLASRCIVPFRPEYFKNSLKLVSYKAPSKVAFLSCGNAEDTYDLLPKFNSGIMWQGCNVKVTVQDSVSGAFQVIAHFGGIPNKAKEIFSKGVHVYVMDFLLSKTAVIGAAWKLKSNDRQVHEYIVVLSENTIEVRADFYEFLEQLEESSILGETKVDFHFFASQKENTLSPDILETLSLKAA